MQITFFWDGDTPDYVVDNMQTWGSAYNATPSIYDVQSAMEFMRSHPAQFGDYSNIDICEAFEASRIPAMKSDIFRVFFAYITGGAYVDGTITALKPIEEFLSGEHDVVVYKRWNGNINNGLFYSAPGSQFLKRILIGICKNVAEKSSNNIWEVTGPKLWNESLQEAQGSEKVHILQHADIAGEYVQFKHDYPHKKAGAHWSDQQKTRSIYRTYKGAKKKVALHIGLHKTATTLIQLSLRNARATLGDDLGFSPYSIHTPDCPDYEQFRLHFTHLRNKVLLNQYKDSERALSSKEFMTARQHLDALLERDNLENILISDENLIGVPIGQAIANRRYWETSFYPKAGILLIALREMLEAHDVTVVWCNREKKSLIESLYSNSVANLCFSGDISEFIRKIDQDSISFEAFGAEIASVFENAKAMDFALLRQGGSHFLKAFGELCGVTIPADIVADKPANSRLSDAEIIVGRALSTLPFGDGQRKSYMDYLKKLPRQEEPTFDLSRLPDDWETPST